MCANASVCPIMHPILGSSAPSAPLGAHSSADRSTMAVLLKATPTKKAPPPPPATSLPPCSRCGWQPLKAAPPLIAAPPLKTAPPLKAAPPQDEAAPQDPPPEAAPLLLCTTFLSAAVSSLPAVEPAVMTMRDVCRTTLLSAGTTIPLRTVQCLRQIFIDVPTKLSPALRPSQPLTAGLAKLVCQCSRSFLMRSKRQCSRSFYRFTTLRNSKISIVMRIWRSILSEIKRHQACGYVMCC